MCVNDKKKTKKKYDNWKFLYATCLFVCSFIYLLLIIIIIIAIGF